MTRIGVWISGLSGWRRLLFAFVMGAVSATAFAPLEFFPALLIGYAALVLLIDGADAGAKPVRRAASAGWAFCFGQFLIGLHWIGYAFLVDPTNHLWQMPFALVSLTAGLALFGALAAAVAARFWREDSARIFVFGICMAGAEWLRGHLFTGFPWNLSAYGWGASLAVLQSASLMGAYGLSFLTILLGGALAELFAGRWRLPAASLLLFAALWSYGVYRLDNTPMDSNTGVSVRLVQPDIPQAEKYVPALMFGRNWQRLIDLSARPGRPSVIVWPEAATGFAVAREPGALAEIGLFTARGQTLITGSERIVRTPSRLTAYNSLYLFGPNGAPPQIYDKFHLVPFGEYVPFARMLNQIGIRQLTVGEGFSSGDHPHVMQVAGAPPMTPLICYEVIFPHAVTDPNAARPGWFVNITDDSWFGPWAGPAQHFLIARVRAIEEGLPIARAANTGISAMIDGNGRVRTLLGLNRLGIVDATLPAALQPTPYARFGDLIFLLFLVTAAFGSFLRTRM
ncbi:MAG TPA: apolipoprotein N-acyltransferase [Rhizomicrobium sp.]|jgi:apolipoprotein N-acyltransferase|nr:apolipoprotein N-acyltransferase [Rhizomicrobium sp.]